jgi:hypothetical protein
MKERRIQRFSQMISKFSVLIDDAFNLIFPNIFTNENVSSHTKKNKSNKLLHF